MPLAKHARNAKLRGRSKEHERFLSYNYFVGGDDCSLNFSQPITHHSAGGTASPITVALRATGCGFH